MKRTKKLTLSALLAALGVVLLLLGSLVELIDLSAAAVASFLVVFVFIELGLPWALLLWAATALTSLLIFPSGASLFYAAFGLYPLLKAALERLPRALEWTLKLLSFGAVLAAYILVGKFVLFLPDAALSGALLWAFIALAAVAFVLYDIALSRLIVFYSLRLRHRFARFLKSLR
jgi:hypothetical protein